MLVDSPAILTMHPISWTCRKNQITLNFWLWTLKRVLRLQAILWQTLLCLLWRTPEWLSKALGSSVFPHYHLLPLPILSSRPWLSPVRNVKQDKTSSTCTTKSSRHLPSHPFPGMIISPCSLQRLTCTPCTLVSVALVCLCFHFPKTSISHGSLCLSNYLLFALHHQLSLLSCLNNNLLNNRFFLILFSLSTTYDVSACTSGATRKKQNSDFIYSHIFLPQLSQLSLFIHTMLRTPPWPNPSLISFPIPIFVSIPSLNQLISKYL